MRVNSKRKDVILLVMSVIFLSGEISFIVNILFNELYANNRVKLTVLIIILLIITTLLIIKTMFSYDLKTCNSKMTLVFDMIESKFIDIPYNPASVNARVLFNNLNNKHQSKIRIGDSLDIVNGDTKEFRDFCNCLAVQLIFSHFLKNGLYKNKIDINYLKDILVKFKFIDVDSMLGGEAGFTIGDKVFVTSQLTLPKGFKITQAENTFLRLDSRYGFVHFSWSVLLIHTCSKETRLLSLFESLDLDSCLQAVINLKMEYGFKPLKIFTKSTVEFEQFIDTCRRNMDEFDEKACLEKFKFEILPCTIEYLNNNFKGIMTNINLLKQG